jgi:hypothetical protein
VNPHLRDTLVGTCDAILITIITVAGLHLWAWFVEWLATRS